MKKKDFRPGDRVRYVGNDQSIPFGALATILCEDRRITYKGYFEAWPDDESLCNPGVHPQPWCIDPRQDAFELVERLPIEELLTSNRIAFRLEGHRRLKEANRFRLLKRIAKYFIGRKRHD